MSEPVEAMRQPKLSRKVYEHELLRLQEELVKMEQWVADAGTRQCRSAAREGP